MADPIVKELAREAFALSLQPFRGLTEVNTTPVATQIERAPLPAIQPPRPPSMTAYMPTVKERLASGGQSALEFLGVDRPRARRVAQTITGGPSSNLPMDIGLLDVAPFVGTAMQTEEAVRGMGRAGQFVQQGDLDRAAVEAGLGLLGLVPGAAGTIKAARPLMREVATTPPVGAIGPIEQARQMAPRSELGFYSAVEETVANIPQAKGTGDQFLAQISKAAGVKPEEIKWTGLDEFLKGKKSVTKAEIQDYLNANRVDVQEVRLESGQGQRIPLTNEEQARLNALREKEEIEGLGGLEADEYSDLLNKEIAFEEFYDKTKFSSYTLPGGENYREILLTLPEDPSKIRNQLDALDAEAKRLYDAGDPRWREVSAQRGELLLQQSRGTYRSPHFDQPNILAHMRVNDRVVDGKKTLFIEEIQSDWHQEGRKGGYAQPETKRLTGVVEAEPPSEFGFAPEFKVVWEDGTFSGGYGSREAAQARAAQGKSNAKAGIPDAPFKTSWHELSLKRAIQEASEKGYDQIAFTTGKTQAERYSLSKQIDAVKATRQPNGLYSLEAYKDEAALGRARNPLIERQDLTAEQLEDTIGKDLAKKIVNDISGDEITKTYFGVDLDVGGEGMKGFYDNILPKSLEKLGKKFDAKVGKTNMDGVEVWQMEITPKMRESVTTKGQPLFAVPVIGAGAISAAMSEEERVD